MDAEAEAKSKALGDGEVLLLENVRFHAEEEANDEAFSKQLAALCDGLFVCDAFGSAHRAHASVVGITKFVRQSAAGLLMEKELAYLGKAISNPERPFVAILGGAKVSDKIEVVQNLMKISDAMLIGGAMAYTFLKSQGLPIGKSLVENDKLDLARNLLEEAKQRNFRLLLPVDHVLAESPDATETRITDISVTPDNLMGLDVGPKTIELFSTEISKARTIVWNGPLGMFEKPAFARARLRLRARLPRRLRREPLRLLAAAIRLRRRSNPVSPSKFRTFRRVAALRSNFLRARNFPGVEALTD